MTVGCRDDKDIKKQFVSQNSVGNMVRKFSFAPIEAKIQLFKSYLVGEIKSIYLFILLLPHLWMCSLASFIPELYWKTYCQF